MTITTAAPVGRWLLYDGACPWCQALARRMERPLRRRGWQLAPLQASWARARVGWTSGARPAEMAVLTGDGRCLGGADAALELSRHFWWARWLRGLAGLPGGRALLHRAYRWLAARRPCRDGECALPVRTRRRPDGRDLVLAASPVLLALAFTLRAPGWVRMWSVAGALFAATKWLVWGMRESGPAPALVRNAGFLFAWPGMDTQAFLGRDRRVTRPAAIEWIAAAVKLLLGAALVWGVTRHVGPPLAAGWTGMIGVVLGLHFGLFHLLSLAWRRAGVNAAPIMNAPWRSTSLATFWGRAWNTGFSVPARLVIFKPLAGLGLGRGPALLAVFLVSGLVHELVISVPAQAGFGLPTAYFLFQGAALLFERSPAGRRLGAGSGWRGWLLTLLCVAGPAFWLFHPPFVHRVIVPFLSAIGAL